MPRTEHFIPIVPRVLAALSLIGLLIAGCGASDFGGDIRVSGPQRHTLDARSPQSDQIRLPGDRVFNIHLKSSQQTPGPDGTARGDSSATPDGTARANATAENRSSASANFQLGHRLENATNQARTVSVNLEYQLRYDVRASDPPAKGTLATANLQFLILDKRQRPVARLVVIQSTSDELVGQTETTQSHQLEIIAEPDNHYDVLLYGKVDVSADEDQQARATLAIDRVRMRLTLGPGPADTQPSPATTQP